MRLPAADTPVWVDGRRSTAAEAGLCWVDEALHCGLGLFETLAVRDGRPYEVHEHLERLGQSSTGLGIEVPEGPSLVDAIVRTAAPISHGWLKIAITRGPRSFVFGGESDPDEEGSPARAVLLRWRRNPADPLAGVKSLNYAASLLGAEEARRRGADEGLWLNTRGHLAEGCSTNLFIAQGGKLFTPGVRDGILPGIVRALALDAARERSIRLHSGKVRLKRLERADEAFVTSSVRGVRPLVEYEGRKVGTGRPGPITRAIAEGVAERRQPYRGEPDLR